MSPFLSRINLTVVEINSRLEKRVDQFRGKNFYSSSVISSYDVPNYERHPMFTFRLDSEKFRMLLCKSCP